MKRSFFGIFPLLCSITIASAHFVFVVPQPGGATAQVILSEDLKPSGEVDAGLIAGAKLTLRDAQGSELPLTLVKSDQAFVTALPGAGTRLIHGVVDLGLTERGGKAFVLLYYPKTVVGDPFDPKQIVGGTTPVEIVPVGKAGALRLKVLVHGNPDPNHEVTVITPDGAQKKLTTGQTGETEALTQTGKYGAWARYWEPIGGEREGKKYAETRNYATLVFDVPVESGAVSDSAPAKITAVHFATLPQATSSFGAAVSDGWLYIYGGHTAPTHSYSTAAVSGQFARLKLSGAGEWEQLPAGPPLQGMNLLAYRGMIYRIGGMAPRNRPGEAASTYSVAGSARFNAGTMKWEELPRLPEPRSSHDMVAIDGKLIVAGGWTLQGAAPTQWLETVAVLDLAADKLEWTTFKQPFKRRALIATAYSGKMYAMGGFDEHSKVVHEVAIYDPKTNLWTKGPVLPGSEMDAFAPAACVHQAQLYVSLADGTLYRLNESTQHWDKSGTATPRVAHRLASDGDTILVIGGAAKGRNSDLIEAAHVEIEK